MVEVAKELRKIVLQWTKDLPDQYRCHEVARLLKPKLQVFNKNVAVRDGIVIYDRSFLLEQFLYSADFPDELNKAIKEEIPKEELKKKLRVFHSWCEVFVGQDEVFVVDWHAGLDLFKDQSLEKVLIIENKKTLPHSYNATGVEIGGGLLLKRFPPYFTKIRL